MPTALKKYNKHSFVMKHVVNKIFTTGKMRYYFILNSSLADLGLL